ncbi:MAG: M23 family metallopeptidase [Candidatus Dependentiae bacterium]
MIRLKTVLMSSAMLFFSWMGYRSIGYFFDNQLPVVSVHGMQNLSYYAGDIHCNIGTNKPGRLSIWVDNAPLVQDFNMHTKNKLYPFIIPTQTLTNGEHSFKVVCTDKSYNANSTAVEHSFVVDNKPLDAVFMHEKKLKVLQGRTLHVKFKVNKDIECAYVKALAERYDCFLESMQSDIYECFIPISCDEKANEYLFSVEVKDRVGNHITLDNAFEIVHCDFKKQTIKVDPEKLKEEKERGRAIAELEEQLTILAQGSPKEKMWQGSFCTPIEIDRVTCEYGTVRTTQERGRYAHKALDVINRPKSVVWATQDGVVALKDRFDFSGNTVVVDHGHGILSLFYHLDDFADIEVGQKVSKGNPLGTLGKTGYATGYHLHWEMRVNNAQVDPMQWTKETF